ncbi:hypothetical protein CVT24_004759, partial [Panaeolus cyanescens]
IRLLFFLHPLTRLYPQPPSSLCLPSLSAINLETMGMSYRRYLSGERIYGCSTCKTHLATIHSMMSRVSRFSLDDVLEADYSMFRNRLSMDSMAELTSSMACRSFHFGMIDPLVEHHSSVNVIEGEPEDRPMTTGTHTVRDIYCCKCSTTLGWKYDKAFEDSQKYKEGKYILERNLLVDVQ